MNAGLNEVKHPLAGTRMTGAEMIIRVLAQEGVDAIFGYNGGAILPTYDAIFRYNAEQGDSGGKPIRLLCRRTSRAQVSWQPDMPGPAAKSGSFW